MAKPRPAIEARFRRGSNALVIVGLLAVACHTLLYWGFTLKPVKIFCLAIPLVLDTVVRVVDPRLWGQELHYYCYLFGMILSGLFLVLGFASKFTSHSGTLFRVGSYLRGLKGLGRFVGSAQLMGSRVFYFAGIVLYFFDGLLALVMENVLRAHFSELRLLILTNLGFHCLVLSYLLFGFVAGLESEAKST